MPSSEYSEADNLEKILDLLPLPVLWGADAKQLRNCNQCFVDLTGIEKSELSSGVKVWTDAFVRRDQKKLKELISLGLATSSNFPVEINAGLKVGKRKSLQYLVSLSPDRKRGNLWFSVLRPEKNESVVDNLIESYTEQREIDRQVSLSGSYKTIEPGSTEHSHSLITDSSLKRSDYDLSAIVELSVDAIISFSLSGEIESWNDGAVKLYGYEVDEVLGKDISILLPEDRKEEVSEILDALSREKIIETYETIRVTKSGEFVHVSLVVSPLKNKDGKVLAGFSVARDITRRKKAEEALLSQAHQLAKTNAELEKFAWMAAHDLKEPIRTMTTYAHLVADELALPPDSDVGAMLSFMTQAGLRATERIQDVLAYSSLGKKEFSIEPTNLNDLLKKVLDDIKQSISEKKAEVKVKDLPIVDVNRSTVMLLFQNLISNALKFSSETPVIEVSSSETSAGFIVAIKDNGIGIDEDKEHGEKIFDMFSRLEPNRYPGTGIGLAICKKVVELHRGRIWFDSKMGEGTTFYVQFPVDAKGA